MFRRFFCCFFSVFLTFSPLTTEAASLSCGRLLGQIFGLQEMPGDTFLSKLEVTSDQLQPLSDGAAQASLLEKLSGASPEDSWILIASYLKSRGYENLLSVLPNTEVQINSRIKIFGKKIGWHQKRNGDNTLMLYPFKASSLEEVQKTIWFFADALFQIKFNRHLWNTRQNLPTDWSRYARQKSGGAVESLLSASRRAVVDIPLHWQEERIAELANFESEMYRLYEDVQVKRMKGKDPGRSAWKFMLGLDPTQKAQINEADYEIWKQSGKTGVEATLYNRYKNSMLFSWYFEQVKRASLLYFSSKMLLAAVMFSVTTVPTMVEAYQRYEQIETMKKEREQTQVQNGTKVMVNDRYMSEEYELALERRDELESRLEELKKDPSTNQKEIEKLQLELDSLIQQYFS